MTELVRYRPAVYMEPCLGGMFNDEFGEYVTYSQAVEIIAAKDKEIEDFKMLYSSASRGNEKLRAKLKAAEAKLAQYEAQDPVGSVAELGIAGSRIKVAHNLNKDLEVGTPLYALPTPTK